MMLTITDLNAEFAKLNMLRGRTPQTTAAERAESRALARLMPYRDGTIFIAKFAGSGVWERPRAAMRSFRSSTERQRSTLPAKAIRRLLRWAREPSSLFRGAHGIASSRQTA